MNSNNVVFSIIIPHKNNPNLLKRCIDSIPFRDDVQIIVVDDNSDKSLINPDNYPGKNRKDLEIIFLDSSQSKFAGRARNIGLSKVKGRWILFADADDYFTENLPKLLEKYKDNNSTDIVYLNSQVVHEDNNVTEAILFTRYINNYKSHRLYAEKVLRYGMFTPWSRMVRTSLVNNYSIRFEEVRTGNDAMFCLNCSKYAKKIDIEESIIYNYFRPSEGSFCSQNRFKYDNIVSRVELGLRMNQLYDSVNYLFKESFLLGYYQNKDKEYRKALIEVLKGHNINIVVDFYHLVLLCVGKLFRFI